MGQIIFQKQYLSTVDADADFNFPQTYVGDYELGAIQLQYDGDGDVTGTFSLEISVSPIGTEDPAFTPLLDAAGDPISDVVVSDGRGTLVWNVSVIGYTFIRVVFAFDTTSAAMTTITDVSFKGLA
tara:strand:+ start:183 stop:560 length:378 start_codon:yes stop_codon:yes gene_type:complete